VNIVSLWVSAQASQYPLNVWDKYRQWQDTGCQVHKGELPKASNASNWLMSLASNHRDIEDAA
jgi:antirestriction protein ArdC